MESAAKARFHQDNSHNQEEDEEELDVDIS
jgi:hypothetical protein